MFHIIKSIQIWSSQFFFARYQSFLYEDGINEVKIKLKKYKTKNCSLNDSYGLIHNESYGHQYWLKIIYKRKSDQPSKNSNESSQKSSFELASHRLSKVMAFRYIDLSRIRESICYEAVFLAFCFTSTYVTLGLRMCVYGPFTRCYFVYIIKHDIDNNRECTVWPFGL